MALNPLMPADAGIDSEEFNEGTRAVEREEQSGAEPLQNRSSREERPERREAAREERAEQDDEQRDERDAHTDDDQQGQTDDEKQRASEAARELSRRRKGLEGRKATIQDQINAAVRERETVRRDTEAGRAERAQLQREIESLREQRRRLDAGEHVEDPRDRRDPTDPRAFDPRRPRADADEERAPWHDARDPRPREENFNDFAEYAEAVGRWGARQEVRRAEFIRERRTQMSERAQWEERRQANYSKRYQDFAKANPDFESEINREDLVLTAPMVDAIKDSEVGPQMLLHLARNSHEIDRIARLHPVHAFGEMKKLEARLEGANSGSRQTSTEQPVNHSKARPPIKPVEQTTSRGSDTDFDIPDENVSDDEHFERMNKRDDVLRKRNGGRSPRGYGVGMRI